MGHRANYIIKEKGIATAYYTHWRGVWTCRDLLVGPEDFIDFVKEFDTTVDLVQYPWIQSFVFLDLDKKEMKFNEMTYLGHTSVKRRYLKVIQEQWKGWKVTYAAEGLNLLNEEFDPKYLEDHPIDYSTLKDIKFEEGIVEFFKTGLIYIDENKQAKIYYLNSDMVGVLLIGDKIFDVLNSKKADIPEPEGKNEILHTVLIDKSRKYIAISEGLPRLIEEVAVRWPGWKAEIVELGYLHLLEEAGIDTAEIKLNENEILEAFKKINEANDDFDPNEIAKTLFGGVEDGVNPHFFENIKPPKPGEKAPTD